MTTVAFAGTTWLCGALLLPPVMNDSAVRWTVACGAGAAMAALAAMWGHGFAGGRRAAPGPAPRGAAEPGSRSVAIRGSNSGNVSTGDRHVPHPPSRGARGSAATSPGERAITIGGDNHGTLTTGDTTDDTAS
ncbi:hypothetical protein [Streptomyces paradoxus]|uniref:Uncharacterized protein n=1 Tax=Streptomyces paradoxus TaxID=66375 RepID=A0A7W9TAA7_9ACTN|nr:hypothetical protein [Streptomyces paradoxus]MBB6076980.1 hypothetical protein [Streptomyces paradoxus]